MQTYLYGAGMNKFCQRQRCVDDHKVILIERSRKTREIDLEADHLFLFENCEASAWASVSGRVSEMEAAKSCSQGHQSSEAGGNAASQPSRMGEGQHVDRRKGGEVVKQSWRQHQQSKGKGWVQASLVE